MTDTLALINVQVTLGNVIVSEHAYDRLRENDIFIHDIEAGILEALWSKITLRLREVRACWRCSSMQTAIRFTLSGDCARARPARPY